MRRLAGLIVMATAVVGVAACTDTSGFEGTAAATPGVEATVRLAESLKQHVVDSAGRGGTPADYIAMPSLAVQAFGVAGALAAAGDPDRAKPFEMAAAKTAEDLATAAVAGGSLTLADGAKQRIIDQASAAAYTADALPGALERLAAALLFADESARAALVAQAADPASMAFDQFAALNSVRDVASGIATTLVDSLRAKVNAGA